MTISIDSLTIHGIGRVALTKNKVLKIFWTLVLLLCLYGVSETVFRTLNSYFKYKSYLLTTTEVSNSLPLPVITVCNGLRQYANEYENKGLSLFTEGFNDYVENYDDFCTIGTRSCQAASLNYEMKKEPLELPSCLVFNPNQNVKQSVPIADMGLRIDFFLNSSDLLPSDYDTFQPPSMAVRVFLHSKEVIPLLLNSAASAKPGFDTKIVIKKVNIKRLEVPFQSNCTSQRDNKTNFYPGNYTLNGCMLSAFSSSAYEKCDFVEPILINYLPYPYNGTRFNMTCMEELVGLYMEKETDCQLPCFEEVYQIISREETKWPFGKDLERLKNVTEKSFGFKPSNEFVQSNFGRLWITYSQFEVITLEETPASTTEKLISDIGGLMGIYLGASMISVTEILAMVSSLLIAWFTKNKLGSKKEVASADNAETENQAC